MLCRIDIDFLATRDVRLDFLVYFAERAVLTAFRIQFKSVYILAVNACDVSLLLLSNCVAPWNVGELVSL